MKLENFVKIFRILFGHGLLSAVSLLPWGVFAQGSLTPSGAPAPTMKTLDQLDAKLEKRTPISSAPFKITNSGSYYLTMNLTVVTGDAITINTHAVTLDLNGFTISSTAASATGTGILLAGSNAAIAILNGHIKGSVTNNGAVYSGGGFENGIFYSGSVPSNVRVAGVSVSGCRGYGIYLFQDNSTAVESCTVQTVGSYGIMAASVSHSRAYQCAIGIYANHASDCSGFSTSGTGGGLTATVAASNCRGYCAGNGWGLNANIAIGCSGESAGSGDGLTATTANTCTGRSNSGIGLHAIRVAIGCDGSSKSGIGLSAYIANSCGIGSGTTTIAYKYNMP